MYIYAYTCVCVLCACVCTHTHTLSPHFLISLFTLFDLSSLSVSLSLTNIISVSLISRLNTLSLALSLSFLLNTHIPPTPNSLSSLLPLFPFPFCVYFPLSSLPSSSLSLIISHSWHMTNLLYLSLYHLFLINQT